MRRLKILHIEDSDEDMELLRRACGAADLPAIFYRVEDGDQAVKYLGGQAGFHDRSKHPLPDLIILDLKMPRMGGFDFLKWLRNEPVFLSLPVLVFTISENAEDKARAFSEGASGYFVKPKDFETLLRIAESFRQFETGEADKNEEPT